MKVFSIAILRIFDDKRDPIFLATAYELSSFGFFQKGSVRDVANFVSIEVSKRSVVGSQQTVLHMGYKCHIKVNPKGVACCAMTDEEYPQVAAFSLINAATTAFLNEYALTFEAYDTNQNLRAPFLDELILKYQDPQKADPMMKIQKDLDETKQVLVKSIDQLLDRGEKLESIAARSEHLSFQTRAFMTNAESMNKCCRYM
eukprot:TRINITY_DN3336_c0_g2_i3.p1 TRINITY_DN3336_c0_g2~~TRINITY_DN3336_c0_g2_i3.p1  ORF type:complete len:201 (+),score=26.19 TRINITY_DN3336_c0_g2_i3:841-1443(+)